MKFLLDIFFPKRCIRCKRFGAFLCPNCFSGIEYSFDKICPACLGPSIDGLTHPRCQTPYGLNGLVTVVSYKGIVKKIIYQTKYRPNLYALTGLMAEIMYEGLIQDEIFMHLLTEGSVFVPVPLHIKRERKRGYNHAMLLAQNLGKKFDTQVITIVIRAKNTKPQFKLSKQERKANMKDAFIIDKKHKNLLYGKTVFVIDDIATTCSTLNECAKVLLRSGAKKVYGLTFAHER